MTRRPCTPHVLVCGPVAALFVFALATGSVGCKTDDDDDGGSATGDGDDGSGDTTPTGSAVSDSGTGDGGDGGTGDTGSEGPRVRPTCATPSEQIYEGSVIVEGDSETPVGEQLAVLDGYGYVRNALIINSTTLTNLDALICIKGVGTEFNVYDNDQLEDLWGLANLEFTFGTVTISENGLLTNLEGLEKVTEMQTLSVTENESLVSLKGLDNVINISSNLIVRYNPLLEDISALTGLQTVGDRFTFTHNPKVCVSDINEIGGALQTPPADGSTASNDDSC